jgi:hypothetical protein
MATLTNFRIAEPILAAKGLANDAQQFSFITIQRPEELKQKAKQSIIRKHAKRDVDRVKAKRHRATIEPLSAGQVEARQETGNAGLSAQLQTLSDGRMQWDANAVTLDLDLETLNEPDWTLPPIACLQPLGAGRGFVPFAPYPVKGTSREIQLLDYSMAYLF